jgi:hypothetical protein
MLTPEYLGDGVYVTSNEDGSVMLTTGHHEQLKADAVIFLEAQQIQSLNLYWERMKETR